MGSKRKIAEVDDFILDPIWDMFPEHKEKLIAIQATEAKVDEAHRIFRETYLQLANPEIKRKILRIFIHHEYIQPTETDKPAYNLYVEGQLLCPYFLDYGRIGQFFEKVQVQVENKKGVIERSWEWSTISNPEGVKSNVFKVKIVQEKPQHHLIRLLLHRSRDPRRRQASVLYVSS